MILIWNIKKQSLSFVDPHKIPIGEIFQVLAVDPISAGDLIKISNQKIVDVLHEQSQEHQEQLTNLERLYDPA